MNKLIKKLDEINTSNESINEIINEKLNNSEKLINKEIKK